MERASSLDSLLGLSLSKYSLSVSYLQVLGHRRLTRLVFCAFLMIGILGFGFWILSTDEITAVERYTALRSNIKDMVLIESEAIKLYAAKHLIEPLIVSDFREFAHRLRLFGKLLKAYEENYSDHVSLYLKALKVKEDALQQVSKLNLIRGKVPDKLFIRAYQSIEPYPASNFLWELEQELFPWAHNQFKSLLELKSNYQGQGMVIPTGSYHLRFAIHLIRHLRALNFQLPIMVAYSGEEDLRSEELAYLRRLKVGILDISTIFNTSELELDGWQIKPYALLAAPFEEVIIADADVVFLQNPEFLFNDVGYLEHGAIIFHDRTLFPGDKDKTEWLTSNLPQPLSALARNTRMYRQLSSHEQESGVVVWNKRKRFLGALAACKMNAKEEREEVTYKQFYGDKESFWIGLEMAGESWTELQPVPGVIGDSKYDNKTSQLVACGRILHFDRQGWPFWFNGAIVTNKRVNVQTHTIMNFTHFAREGTWEFVDSCLDHDVTPLNNTLKTIINNISALYVPKINFRRSAELTDSHNTLLGK